MAIKEVKKETNIDNFQTEIEKLFGKGTIITANEEIPPGDIIPLSSLTLCNALGKGGFAKNKIIEVIGWESAGKSTLSYDAIANAQKEFGDNCLLIDKENSFDKFYAEKLGVDLDKLQLAYPNSLEDNYALIEKALDSKLFGLIVVDSLTSFQPQATIDSPGGAMGKESRINSDRLRMVNDKIRNSNCCIIFINQIREKLGVMFGCFHYDTIVNFTDGRNLPIGKVVDEKIQGNVFTINEKTGIVEEKPIVNWFNNGKINKQSDFITILTNSLDGKGRYGITCTKNHEILTENNVWKKAGELTIDDKLMSKYLSKINNTVLDFLRGCFVGDCSLQINKNKANFTFQDNKNIDYVNWKVSKLSPFIDFHKVKIPQGYKFVSEFSTELLKIKETIINRDPLYLLNDYTPLGLAILYMDDGHYDNKKSHNRALISFKRFKNNVPVLDTIFNKFKNIFNTNDISINYKNGNIIFNKSATRLLFEMIHTYIPKCMEYKLDDEFKNKYIDFSLNNKKIFLPNTVNILSITEGSKRKFRNKIKYDIGVADNHNYTVGSLHNGIFVHNSPETTSGGNALKFYAHVRIMIRRKEIKADKQSNTMHFKIIKNKLAPPMKEAETTIIWGKGFDKESEIFYLAKDFEIIKKHGKKVTYNGEIFELTDKDAMEEYYDYLNNNPAIKQEITNLVMERLNNPIIIEETHE